METFTYTLNASPETPYTAPLTLSDGAHTLSLRARDAAGHVTELSQSVNVDTLPPQAGLTLSAPSFCPECGQTLDVLVQASDGGSGLQGWQVFLGGAPWQSGSQTEQIFTLSAALAAGSHTLRLEARDAAGNLRATEAAFFVLAPTPTAPPTAAPANTVPQPTLPPPTVAALNTPSPTAIPATAAPLNTATPTRAPLVSTFQSSNRQSSNLQSHNLQSHNLQSPNLPSPTPLWGAAALAAIAGASGLALVAKRRRKADEERQAAEAAQKAALRNAAQALRLAQNWLTGGQIKKAAWERAREIHRTMEKGYMAKLGEKIKSHYKKSFNQTPPGAVVIPPLASKQYVALSNWNVVAQVAAYGITATVGSYTGLIITKNPLIGAVGAVLGVMWGAYEANCIASVQEQFDQAYAQNGSVRVWREGIGSFAVHGDGETYTLANGPLSATYVAVTTFLLTGKIP